MKGTEDQMFITNFKIEYKLLTFGNVQELLQWLRNVWHVRKTPVANPGSRYHLTDIVWYKHQEKVFEEITSILNLETANTNTPGWFQLRTKAAKNIIQSMNEEDRKELEDEAERMLKEGFPQDIQRKSVADYGRGWPSLSENVRLMLYFIGLLKTNGMIDYRPEQKRISERWVWFNCPYVYTRAKLGI